LAELTKLDRGLPEIGKRDSIDKIRQKIERNWSKFDVHQFAIGQKQVKNLSTAIRPSGLKLTNLERVDKVD
jgi:hypothetical protein